MPDSRNQESGKGLQKNFKKSFNRIVLIGNLWLYLLNNLKTKEHGRTD